MSPTINFSPEGKVKDAVGLALDSGDCDNPAPAAKA
jgi:hypothetical protein